MKKINKSITVLVTLLIALQANAVGMKEAAWYLSIDVNQLANNELIKYLHGQSDDKQFDINEIPNEIDSIIMYGDSRGSDDATVVLKGDFSHFSVYDYALDFIHSHEENAEKLFTKSVISYAGKDIQVMIVNDKRKSKDDTRAKELYFSAINNEISIVSLNLDEVKNWIGNEYPAEDLNNGSIFSVLVNVKSALAHMGMNLEKNSHMLHSEIFKKVTKVSASVTEINTDIVFEVAMTSVDTATATQIEQIISGLIAMNNLSGVNDDNQLHVMLMQNLSIEKDGNIIMISTFAAIDELKKMDIQQHMKHSNDEKIEVVLGL